ncbi:MAG: FAD-dependent oxidoreductase [Thermoproteota archaeon]
MTTLKHKHASGIKKRVIILGAGYGGIFAAANLCKKELFDVTIIDRNSYHQLLQQIHHLLSGSKKAEDVTTAVEDLFNDQSGGISIIKEALEGIDLGVKSVNIQKDGGADALSYDYVIIALGAETQYFGVDGAQQHCLPFRSVQDALKIMEIVERLSAGSSVVIAGGGQTGVNLAAALFELPAVKNNKIRITTVDAADGLLPGWDERLSATSQAALVARGIKIVTGKRIVKVNHDSVGADSCEKLRSDCTIWTAGVKGRSIKTVPEVDKRPSQAEY